MVVDRGSLNYSIKITTGKTFANLRKFKKELKEAREEFVGFRRDLNLGGKDSAAAAKGMNQLAGSLERVNKAQTSRNAITQTAKDARAARGDFKKIVTELVLIRKELSKVERQSKKTNTSIKKTGKEAQKAGRRGETAFTRLRAQIKRTEGSSDKLAGSFLRMGGIISTFVVAQSILDGFRALIGASIEFNRTIERSELGIAAILTAVGEVRGAFGETVTSGQQLSLAMVEARKQTQLLRKDALTTAATFEQLLDVFQVALAPGLVSGLDVDQIRRFALSISQAALALGVAQNQLSEEIRSILSGTIRPQTTRIAVALNITNKDINRVRELGQLGKFLEERFAAFGEAGKKALTTVDGLLGRIADGFSQLAGEAGKSVGFFDDVKDTLVEVLDLLIDFDEFGFPSPDPQTLQVLQVFFDAIKKGFDQIKDGLQAITFDDAINTARQFANAIVAAVNIIIGVAQGAADSFRFLGELIREVAEALGFDQQDASVRNIARSLTSIVLTLTVIRASTAVLLGLFNQIFGVVKILGSVLGVMGAKTAILIPLLRTMRNLVLAIVLQFQLLAPAARAWAAQLFVAGGALRNIALTLLRIAAAIAVVIGSVKFLIQAFTGIELSIGETVEAIGLSFKELFIGIGLGGKLAFQALANAISLIFTKVLSDIAKSFANLAGNSVAGLVAVMRTLKIVSEETRVAVEDVITSIQAAADNTRPIKLFDTDATIREIKEAREASKKAFGDLAAANAERLQNQRDEEFLLKQQRDAADKDALDGIKLQTGAMQTLLEVFEAAGAQFTTTRSKISEVQEVSDRLRNTLEGFALQDSFDIDPSVAGTAGQIQKTVQQERIRLAKELQTIRRQELELQGQVGRASEAALANAKQLQSFNQQEQAVISSIDEALVSIIGLRQKEEGLITQSLVARAEERSAIERGATADAQAARQRRASFDEQLQGIRGQKAALESQINTTREMGRLDDEALKFVKERLTVLSTEASLKLDLAGIDAEIARLEQQSLDIQRRQAEQIARRTQAAQETAQALRIQLTLAQDLNALQAGAAATGAASRLVQLRAETAQQKLQGQQEVLSILLQVKSLDQTIKRVKATRELNPELFAQRDALANQVGLLQQINEQEQERLLREQERARILSEGSAGEAIEVGTRDFIEAVGTIQEQLAQLTTSLLQTLSSGISSAIVNSIVGAFTEGGDFVTQKFLDGLQQAAGQLLQDIANQLLATVVDSIISSLLTSILTTTTAQVTAATTAAGIEQASAQIAGASRVTAASTAAAIEIQAAQVAAAIRAAGSAAGAATGGLIQGFDGGGHVGHNLPRSTPPPGIAKSDTVAAYLTPGEFVQRVSAVRHYGVDVMRALNKRMIDPSLLKSLAGVKKVRNIQATVKRGAGYAEGDLVRAQAARAAQNVVSKSAETGAAAAPLVGVPLGNDTMEQLLASGKAAFDRHLRDNAADIDGILRGGRTGG